METYRVVSITDRKGNPRIEGRYPLRVGRMCKKPTPRNGDTEMYEVSNTRLERERAQLSLFDLGMERNDNR